MDKKAKLLLENWQNEKEAVMHYSFMAKKEKDTKKSKIYQKLAEVENKHAKIWEEELGKYNITPCFKPSAKLKILGLIGKIFGHKILLDILEKTEGSTVGTYSRQADIFDDNLNQKLKSIIPEEKGHSRVLNQISSKPTDPLAGERWHRGGGLIRDIIFGMNDGLLSIFSLITGIVGAQTSNRIVLLAGLSGAIAGAISMAAGAFVSTKAEVETLEKNLEAEKKELEFMPEAEEEELALMYESKGFKAEDARHIAKTIISDKDTALDIMAREELGVDPNELGSPYKAALASGLSFVVGSSIPITPFILVSGRLAFYITLAFSLGGFFIIGAVRTIVTGRKPLMSGLEMFLIGSAAALITYLIGKAVGVSID